MLTALSLLLSGFLLFLVEPLVARQLLPLFGGAATVWLTAMLFFQCVLLAGYLIADQLARRLSPRLQALLFGALLLAGLPQLPPDAARLATGGGPPLLRVLLALAGLTGLPYLALSVSGPLLQSFWARERGAPWRLYALSNGASLLGLLAYPVLFEPLLTLPTQARLWAAGYALQALLGLLVAVRAARLPATAPAGESAAPASGSALPVRRWAWLAVPACTSALLLGVTAHLTQNVAPIPLLWVAPLALYLVSFLLAFESHRPPRRAIWLPLGVLGLGHLAWACARPPPDQVVPALCLELLSFLAVATCAHGELVRERPAARDSTRFYLSLSAGSALGALFAAVAAPLLFDTELELPVALFALGLSLAGLLFREKLHVPGWEPRARVLRTAQVLGLLLLGLQLWSGERHARAGLRWAGRSFYGALRVSEDGSVPTLPARVLFHGTTLHGVELAPPADPRRPVGYYGPSSGAGRALRALQAGRPALRVGVVGLGAGVLAAFCRPGDRFTFYELDPLVLQVARAQFGFLARCPGSEVLLGDARLTLQAQEPQRFDLLLLDAFSSDAIPVHLLTREAFALFQRHLSPGGQLLVHVSNRYLDLSPLVAAQAAELGLLAFHLEDQPDDAQLLFATRFVLLVHSDSELEGEAFRGAQPRRLAPGARVRPWSDAYSNLLALLQ